MTLPKKLTAILFCCVLFPTASAAQMRIAVAPIQGDAKYPLVMNGIRQVLASDLDQTGQFHVIDASSLPSQISSSNLSELASSIDASVILLGFFSEGAPKFTFILRAYDVQSGYSLGSRQLSGTYGEIKFLQDRLLNTALDLLRTSISPAQRSRISKTHTAAVGAVVALGEADAALQEKRYVDALEGFAKSRAIDPKFNAPQYQLAQKGNQLVQKVRDPTAVGRAYAIVGNSAKSMSSFNRALTKNPNDVSALVGKADLLLQTGKPAQAIKAYRMALRLDRKNSAAALGIARAYQKTGKSREALGAYELARDSGATNPEVYEALGSLYLQGNKKRDAADSYNTAGVLAQRAVNFRKAQQFYTRANNIAPSVDAMERQAAMYLATGNVQLAITILTKALFLDQRSDKILANLGYAYYLNGQPSQAVKMLRRAYDLNSSNYEANLYLGILYLQDRELLERAVKHLEIAARLRPNDRATQYELAHAYLENNKPVQAVHVLEKLAKALPRDPQTHKELGDAYMAAEEYTSAQASYSRALELQPDFLAAREALAKVYLQTGQRKKALEEIERVYAIDASRNIFVTSGGELISKLTHKEFITLCLMFPKMVPSDTTEVPVNQVGLLQIQEPQDWRTRIEGILRPYQVNYKRIRRDLELALYSQYRVIPRHRMVGISSGKMPEGEFDLDSYLRATMTPSHLDGMFGFQVINTATSGNVTSIAVDLKMFTSADSGRYGIADKATLPMAVYPKTEILQFNPLAVIAYGALFLVFALPFGYITIYRSHVRGKGRLRVIINYDPRMESFLTLKLSKKQEKERDSRLIIVKDKQKYEKRKYKQLLRQKGAWVRQMVGRITDFQKVPARDYYCYLYGTIEDGTFSKKTIGNYYMVQRVKVEKNAVREITFQLEKEEAFITVYIRKGEEAIAGAEIRVNKNPDIVYARGEAGAFIYCKKGEHFVRVSHEGRTVEHKITVNTLDDQIVNIDLLSAEEAEELAVNEQGLQETAQTFQDQGRLDDAARLYEKAGEAEKAQNIRAEARISEGDLEAAAKEYLKARDFFNAAETYRELGNEEKSRYLYGLHAFQEGDYKKAVEFLEGTNNHAVLAKVYEKLGEGKKAQMALANGYLHRGQKIEAAQIFVRLEEFAQAAEVYESLGDLSKAAVLHAKDGNYAIAGELFAQAGDVKKAAIAFEKGGDLEQAVSLFRDLGDIQKVIELLVRGEQYDQAAVIYREQGMIDEAIALCQKVQSYHSDFPKMQLLLAQMFVEKGLDDLAIKTFAEVRSLQPEIIDQDSMYAFGSLLEKTGKMDEALSVFEELLQRDFHYKDVSIKIKELKAKSKAPKAAPAAQAVSETVGGAMPVEESRYQVLEEIGRGAMGVVYKAKDKTLDRIVAIKMLPHTLKDDQEALENLMREAQTAARLNHPNIVTVYDVGQEGGNYFIAMEYVQGKTLDNVLKHVKKVDVNNFMHIAKTLGGVIGYAHEQKVIHRDVKPSNILLMPNRTVKLMDFGLAKVLQDMSIDKTMLRGTPLYMSPEQVLGKDIDHRTDIYSLGVIFYEMLGGKTPFYEGDIMYAHLHTPPPPLSDFVPENIPKEVVNTVMTCLDKDKTKRPSSAAALCQAMGITS